MWATGHFNSRKKIGVQISEMLLLQTVGLWHNGTNMPLRDNACSATFLAYTKNISKKQ